MNKKRKIPVRELVEDITGGRLADGTIMKKYDMNHRAFIYILGYLAEKRKISFKRVVGFIRNLLNKENVEFAEACLQVIEKYHTGVWGVQSMIKGLEKDLLDTKNRLAKQQDTITVSKSLAWFEFEYPGVFLHPSVVSSVKVFEKYPEQITYSGIELVTNQTPFDTRSRLNVYSEYVPFFKKYQPAEAIRMWHYISVVLFARKGVEHFVIKGMMDAVTCDVCMHLDGTRIGIAGVLEAAGKPKKHGKVLSDKPFPSLISVEDLTKSEKEHVLIQNGWSLPPFCENCRCQIFPLL